jgi:hypothetical protein
MLTRQVSGPFDLRVDRRIAPYLSVPLDPGQELTAHDASMQELSTAGQLACRIQ